MAIDLLVPSSPSDLERPGRAASEFFGAVRADAKRVDQPAETHVAHYRPAELHDLLLVVELAQFVEERGVDILMIHKQAFREVERGLLRVAEPSAPPIPDAGGGLLVEGVSFP